MGRAQKYGDWALILLINLMWATQAPVIRWIGAGAGPVALAFVPMIASTALFLPLLVFESRRKRRPLLWRRADTVHFLASGLFGYFFLQLAYTLGAQRTLAANAGMITLTIPAFAALAASFLLKERLNAVRVAAFAVSLAGVLLTSLGDLRGADLLQGRYLAGNLIFLAACAGCGFYNAYCKFLVARGYTELEILVFTSLIGSLASLPLFVWLEPLDAAALAARPQTLWGLAELSLIVFGVSMLLFFHVLKRMDIMQATLGNYLLPFFIALLAVLFLNESITAPMMLGGAVILASTLALTVFEDDLLGWRQKGPALWK